MIPSHNAKNFKVFQASAGSGKTYTIVKEYLKLCLSDVKSIDNFKHILAITFTNASANDMKKKIVDELNEIIDSKVVEPKTMEADLLKELNITDVELKRNAALLRIRIFHDYSSFCVSTIDSFVQKLSRTFARDLGLPSQYSVSIDEDDVAATITENLGMQINPSNSLLVQSLTQFSQDQFANESSIQPEAMLSAFVAKLMTEKAFQKDEKNNIKDLPQYQQTLDFLNKKVSKFEKEVKAFLDAFKAIEAKYGLDVSDYSNGRNGFYSFINGLAQRKYEPPKPRFVEVAGDGSKWPSASAKKRLSSAEIKAIGDEIQKLFEVFLSNYNKGLAAFLFYKSQRGLLYLYALRLQIREAFVRLAQEEEVVHISEFNKLLNNVLGDFSVPFVYERIGEYYQHVFVDEFQDTSVLQWQNLLPLVDNGLSSNQMSMVVGDGKQSIYRFRSGEVEQIVQLPEIYALPTDERAAAFAQYQRNLVDNFDFTNLGTNYRSFANVVHFNNAFFEATIAKEPNETLRKVYQDENQTYKKKVSIAQIPDKTEEGLVQVELYDAENQPDYSCQRIEALIHELEDKGYELADITVLVRNSKLGSKVANYLNDKGIPVVSQDSILLKTSNKVQLLVNTLHYLIENDNASIISNVLYYNHLVHNPAFDGDVSTLFDDVRPVVKQNMLLESALGIAEGTLGEALSQATCLYDLCASLTRIYGIDTICDAYLNYFMEEVNAFQSAQKEGIMEFLGFWEQKQSKLAVKVGEGNAVRIMTIHKSKGLEFNVVIYPDAITDLDEKLNKAPAEEWVRPEDLGFEAIPNLEKVLFKLDKTTENMGSVAAQHYLNEKVGVRLDNLNLLYVAFTRAKQRLYIIAKQGKSDKPNVIREFLEDESVKINIKKVSPEVSGVDAQMYRFGDANSVNPKPKPTAVKTSITDSSSMDWMSKVSVDATPSVFWSSETDKWQPREWGDLVHKILSEIQTDDDIDSALEPYLLDGTLDDAMAKALKDKFMQMVKNPLIGVAFNKDAKVKNECDILYNGEVKRPDRYAELPDSIYLLDYKTGQKLPKYHDQLREYASALTCLTDKEIWAYLVYLSQDVIEVERV